MAKRTTTKSSPSRKDDAAPRTAKAPTAAKGNGSRSNGAKSNDAKSNGAALGFEATLWLDADKLRNNLDAAPSVSTMQHPGGKRLTA
ncbi:MAG: hypothetical protein K1X74_04180 [Pirellulales bacterium]|nr:hypothetical protein [Pirellulales bacterium]